MKRIGNMTFYFLKFAWTVLPVLTALLLPVTSHAQDSLLESRQSSFPIVRSSVLPAEEAFALNTLIEAPDTLVLFWEVKENYYLYKKSIAVTDKNGEVVAIGELPQAEIINDEFFGEVDVYFDRLVHRIPLSLLSMENNNLNLTLQYQGCAKDLYCYPMQIKQIALTLPK